MKPPLIDKPESEIKQLPVALKALWYTAHDQWDTAHKLVQDDPSPDCAWVHAHLHRVEGDLANARYWYQQAGKKPATDLSLQQELHDLIAALSESH